MIESLLQSGIGGLLMYHASSLPSIAFYTVSTVVLCLILAFLAVTAYFHYLHWRYSHIPQPKRPRLAYIIIII
jgi:membrane protein YdbS with pleckstrin-like domain